MPSTQTTLLLAVAALASQVSAHCLIPSVYGANGFIGTGYGVNRYGKFPRTGTQGNAGGDATIFQPGVDLPNPPCGETPELGELDAAAWLSQTEGAGVPSAYPNGSVIFDAFMVNSDGGGSMKCEFNEDANLGTWKPLTMETNMEGNDGVLMGHDRTNYTIIATFPSNARCFGGIAKNTCVVRCRTGRQTATKIRYRFGGCFGLRLNGTDGETESSSSSSSSDTSTTLSNSDTSSTSSTANTGNVHAVVVSSNSNTTPSTETTTKTTEITLTKSQMKTIVNAVVKKMKAKKMVYGKHARRSLGASRVHA